MKYVRDEVCVEALTASLGNKIFQQPLFPLGLSNRRSLLILGLHDLARHFSADCKRLQDALIHCVNFIPDCFNFPHYITPQRIKKALTRLADEGLSNAQGAPLSAGRTARDSKGDNGDRTQGHHFTGKSATRN